MTVAAVSFVLLAGPLMWALTRSRGAWWLKLPLIVGVPLWGFAVWQAAGSFDGYPARHCIPPRALFVAALVDEPRAIYIWAVPPATTSRASFGYRPDREPRAYQCPYTRGNHQAAQQAHGMAKKGGRVELQTDPKFPGRYRAYRLQPAMQPKGQ